MNMKKNGFCMESTSKRKFYDNPIPTKHPQILSNEESNTNKIYGRISISKNGILRVSLSFIIVFIYIE